MYGEPCLMSPHSQMQVSDAPVRRSRPSQHPVLSLLLLLALLPRAADGFVVGTQPPLSPSLSQRASRVVAREIPLLKDVEAYDSLVESAVADNRIVCIKFYASWCRACKAMAPKFEKVAAPLLRIVTPRSASPACCSTFLL